MKIYNMMIISKIIEFTYLNRAYFGTYWHISVYIFKNRLIEYNIIPCPNINYMKLYDSTGTILYKIVYW